MNENKTSLDTFYNTYYVSLSELDNSSLPKTCVASDAQICNDIYKIQGKFTLDLQEDKMKKNSFIVFKNGKYLYVLDRAIETGSDTNVEKKYLMRKVMDTFTNKFTKRVFYTISIATGGKTTEYNQILYSNGKSYCGLDGDDNVSGGIFDIMTGEQITKKYHQKSFGVLKNKYLKYKKKYLQLKGIN